MAEAVAALSLTASIFQVISFGSKVVARLKDFKSDINEFPKAFRDIKTELPLLLDTLKRTKEKADLGTISQETQDALLPVINGCRNQAELLDDMLTKVIPETNDSSWQRKRKAIASLGVEKKTQAITDTLRGYVQILTYYQAGSLARLENPPTPLNISNLSSWYLSIGIRSMLIAKTSPQSSVRGLRISVVLRLLALVELRKLKKTIL